MPLMRRTKGDPRINKLTDNERKLAKEYIRNKFNKKKAALKVYDVKARNASNLANQVLQRPHVQEYVQHLLDQAGLRVEDLANYTKDIIANNLQGKPSQAVAASMIQYAYKLHNAVPATRSISGKIDLNKNAITQKDFDEVKQTLKDLNEKASKLLGDS